MDVHDIDRRLIERMDDGPEDRLATLWHAFEQQHGVSLPRPVSEADRARVQAWLLGLRALPQSPVYMAKRRFLSPLVSLSMTEKSGLLAQLRCPACEVVVAADGSIPLHVTTPINVDPWSSQSSTSRTAIRDSVREEMTRRGTHSPYVGGPICLTVISVVPTSRRRMDVDNLVKGLLDSLQGVMYVNDSQVQCLTTRRVGYKGTEGYYLISARAVHDYGADVVFDDGESPNIVVGSRIGPRAASAAWEPRPIGPARNSAGSQQNAVAHLRSARHD